jgi:hypothetical protein
VLVSLQNPSCTENVTAIVVKISDATPLALPNTGSQQHYRFVRFGTPAASAGGTVYNPVRQKSDAEYLTETAKMLDQRYPMRHGR